MVFQQYDTISDRKCSADRKVPSRTLIKDMSVIWKPLEIAGKSKYQESNKSMLRYPYFCILGEQSKGVAAIYWLTSLSNTSMKFSYPD